MWNLGISHIHAFLQIVHLMHMSILDLVKEYLRFYNKLFKQLLWITAVVIFQRHFITLGPICLPWIFFPAGKRIRYGMLIRAVVWRRIAFLGQSWLNWKWKTKCHYQIPIITISLCCSACKQYKAQLTTIKGERETTKKKECIFFSESELLLQSTVMLV